VSFGSRVRTGSNEEEEIGKQVGSVGSTPVSHPGCVDPPDAGNPPVDPRDAVVICIVKIEATQDNCIYHHDRSKYFEI